MAVLLGYKIINTENDIETLFDYATGAIPYGMTNDYMFHMVIQSSENVQKGLLSSLLHIPKKEILSVVIENPIEIGEAISEKTFVLDIRIILNGEHTVNIEMQVSGSSDWADRSLVYTCREFDRLARGQDYGDLRPVTHIGIIDFTLFDRDDEFYSSYKLLNLKNYRIYNGKFTLNVLSLNHINNATEEDRKWHIDKWAALFKASTWEGLKMICQNLPELEETSRMIYQMNADEKIREQCRRREEYECHERAMKRKIAVAEKERDEAKAERDEAKAEREKVKAELEEVKLQYDRAKTELLAEIESLKKELKN